MPAAQERTISNVDISKDEQRILHALAQGGQLLLSKSSAGRIIKVDGITRDGWRMPAISPRLFRKLKAKRAIASRAGGPYRITRRGLELVRSQPDNR
jgi:uncharacterized protein YjhX (UPF0386 family)